MKYKCKHCGAVTSAYDTVCANCHKKEKKVHELWLVCQEIKKLRKKK